MSSIAKIIHFPEQEEMFAYFSKEEKFLPYIKQVSGRKMKISEVEELVLRVMSSLAVGGISTQELSEKDVKATAACSLAIKSMRLANRLVECAEQCKKLK